MTDHRFLHFWSKPPFSSNKAEKSKFINYIDNNSSNVTLDNYRNNKVNTDIIKISDININKTPK